MANVGGSSRAKERFAFLTATTDDEARVLIDQTPERARFEELKAQAPSMAKSTAR
jgi:hypothetical protein